LEVTIRVKEIAQTNKQKTEKLYIYTLKIIVVQKEKKNEKK